MEKGGKRECVEILQKYGMKNLHYKVNNLLMRRKAKVLVNMLR